MELHDKDAEWARRFINQFEQPEEDIKDYVQRINVPWAPSRSLRLRPIGRAMRQILYLKGNNL